jgi:type IV secretory pathway VirB10-like protein
VQSVATQLQKQIQSTMINLTFLFNRFVQKAPIWMLLCGFSFTSSAQQTGVVKETLTNKNYANTTEVHKKATATDAEVLSQLEGNYGIGDEVRISVAPPPKVSDSLSKKTAKPIYVMSSLPTIPEGDSPIQVSTKSVESKIEEPSTVLKKDEKTEKSKAFVFEEPKNVTVTTQKNDRVVVAKSTKSTTSSKGFYSAKRSSRGERFLFFFKKKQSKSKVTYHNRDSSKYGCYKF